MGMTSYLCQVCGRGLMSDHRTSYCYEHTPAWMRDVVVFMPCGLRIEGEYTGYQTVKTDKTQISPHVPKRWVERDHMDLTGVSPIYMAATFVSSRDNDHGYLSIHQWEDSYITNPCCYHRACWEAVGCPEGYRAPSLIDRDQGFGSGGSLNQTNSMMGPEAEDPLLGKPVADDYVIGLWAANAVTYFVHMMAQMFAYMKHADEQRELWSFVDDALDRGDELIKKLGVD